MPLVLEYRNPGYRFKVLVVVAGDEVAVAAAKQVRKRRIMKRVSKREVAMLLFVLTRIPF